MRFNSGEEIPQRPPRQEKQNIICFTFNGAWTNNIFADDIGPDGNHQKQTAVIEQPVKHRLAHGLRSGRNGRQPPHHTRQHINKKSQVKKCLREINAFCTQKFDGERTVN